MIWGLTRVAFGCTAVDEIAPRQRRLCAVEEGAVRLTSRRIPRRPLAGGRLFWIIRHTLVARQDILSVEEAPAQDGPIAAIRLAPTVVPLRPRPCRAHQGWRYLADADWPADSDAGDPLPPALAATLEALGLA